MTRKNPKDLPVRTVDISYRNKDGLSIWRTRINRDYDRYWESGHNNHDYFLYNRKITEITLTRRTKQLFITRSTTTNRSKTKIKTHKTKKRKITILLTGRIYDSFHQKIRKRIFLLRRITPVSRPEHRTYTHIRLDPVHLY